MTEPEELDIGVESHEGTTVMKPVGDVDLSRSPVLRNAIRSALDDRPGKLIIDLSSVSYMDSSGVATLVEAMQISRKIKARLVLCSLTERVQSIFEIARLDQVFAITDDLDSAKAV